jgi:hypothetical protein
MLYCIRHSFQIRHIFQTVNMLYCVRSVQYVLRLHAQPPFKINCCMHSTVHPEVSCWKQNFSGSTDILQPWSLFIRLSCSCNWRLWSPRWGVEVYCTLSLTLTLDGGGSSAPCPGPLYLQEREPVPILQKAECAPRASLVGCENLASHWDSILGPSSRYWVTVSQLILKLKKLFKRMMIWIRGNVRKIC